MILTKDYKLVYNDKSEILIYGKIEGKLETIFPCIEFDNDNEMREYIKNNNLIINQDIEDESN